MMIVIVEKVSSVIPKEKLQRSSLIVLMHLLKMNQSLSTMCGCWQMIWRHLMSSKMNSKTGTARIRVESENKIVPSHTFDCFFMIFENSTEKSA